MVDVFAGPNAPLAFVFKLCGWQATAWDKLIYPEHDLATQDGQDKLSQACADVVLVAAASPCDTKARIREILRIFPDGRPAPGPLRSEEYPEGLPNLSGPGTKRVATDNRVTSFVLDK